MKTSGTLVGGALRPEAYNAFASYLVKTVQAYAAQGIPVAAITLQNEPHFVPLDYPGSYLDAPEQAALIGRYVGPAFAAAGLGTRILAWDHNWNEPDYPVSIMQDPAAARYTSGAAYHCYAGDLDVMTRFHEAFPFSSAWVTECSTGAWDLTPFNEALYENMRLLIRSTRNWAEAVAKWNIALDDVGGPHTGGCTSCVGAADGRSRDRRGDPQCRFLRARAFQQVRCPGRATNRIDHSRIARCRERRVREPGWLARAGRVERLGHPPPADCLERQRVRHRVAR